MKLFDDFERTYTGRANHDHSSYKFINESTWRAAYYVRSLLTLWSKDFPVDSDFVSRFRSDNYQMHVSAFFEMVIFRWFTSQEYKVTLHEIASKNSTRRPDFCISRTGERKFFAECTLSALPDHDPGKERLKNRVLDILEAIPCPHYWLNVSFERCSTSSIPKRKIVDFVTKVIQQGVATSHSSFSANEWIFNESGWQIGFSLFPKAGAKRTLGAIHGEPGGIVYSEKPLRSALDKKRGSNYGKLEHPYVICVNSADFYLDTLSVMQTLFGERARQDGFSLSERGSDGFFIYNGKPINRSVSAVLIANNLVPWNLHVAKITLWHNPFASYPLDTNYLNVNQNNLVSVGSNNFTMKSMAGKSLGEMLQIDSAYMDHDVE